jgi:hypothetical protein
MIILVWIKGPRKGMDKTPPVHPTATSAYLLYATTSFLSFVLLHSYFYTHASNVPLPSFLIHHFPSLAFSCIIGILMLTRSRFRKLTDRLTTASSSANRAVKRPRLEQEEDNVNAEDQQQEQQQISTLPDLSTTTTTTTMRLTLDQDDSLSHREGDGGAGPSQQQELATGPSSSSSSSTSTSFTASTSSLPSSSGPSFTNGNGVTNGHNNTPTAVNGGAVAIGAAALNGVNGNTSAVAHGKRPAVRRVDLPGRKLYDDSMIDREEYVRLLIQSLRDVGYMCVSVLPFFRGHVVC